MKRHLIIIIRALSIVFLVSCSGATHRSMAQTAADAIAMSPSVAMPSCMVVMDYGDTLPAVLPDSVFNAMAGITIYNVNSTELRPQDPFVRLLDSVILPMANVRDWTLLGIEVRGGASPEGPYDNNVRLSSGRAASILQYINKRLIHSRRTDEIKVSTVPEDYAYLLWMLQRDNDPGADILSEIIERRGLDDHAAIKSDMQQVDGGRYWSRLLAEYFPAVRAGRVMLYFMPYRPSTVDMQLIEPRGFEIETPLPDKTGHDLAMHAWHPQRIERRHMLSVGTNLLYDAFYMPQYGCAPMPNVNLELYPKRGNFTFRFQFLFPYYHRWSKHKFFQIRDYHFEARYYFRPGFCHTGWYLGTYVNNNKYGIGLSATKGWEGEGCGAALKAGYVMRLGHSKRWRLEAHVAVGGYITRYDPYVYGNPITGEDNGDYYYDWKGGSQAFHRRNYRFTWIGPTEVGLTLSYDLLFWRRSRAGVSFISYEDVR